MKFSFFITLVATSLLSAAAAVIADENQPAPSGHPTPEPTATPEDTSSLRKAEAGAAVGNAMSGAEPSEVKIPPVDTNYLPGTGGHVPGQAVEP